MTESDIPKIITRKQAKELGLRKYYTGNECPYGHLAERYTSTGMCCPCIKKYDRERKRDPELRDRYRMNTIRKNPIAFMFSAAKKRTLDTGLPFDLEKEDVHVTENCPCCDIKMTIEQGAKEKRKTREGKFYIRDQTKMSIDRVDNTKGYVKGNVAIICWRCNQLKADATAQELRRIADWMDSFLKK